MQARGAGAVAPADPACPACRPAAVADVVRPRLPAPATAPRPGATSPDSLLKDSSTACLGIAGSWTYPRPAVRSRPFFLTDAAACNGIFGPGLAPLAPAPPSGDAGDWMVILVVDDTEVRGSVPGGGDEEDAEFIEKRRRSGAALVEELRRVGTPYVVCSLHVGDFFWVAAPRGGFPGVRIGATLGVKHPFWAACRAVGCVLERKTVGDLHASLRAPCAAEGGRSRLTSQLERMPRAGLCRCGVLFELSSTSLREGAVSVAVDPYPALAVAACGALARGFAVFTSADVRGTALLLRSLTCALGAQVAQRRDFRAQALSAEAWLRRTAVTMQELACIRAHADAAAQSAGRAWLPSLCRALRFCVPAITAALRGVPRGCDAAGALAALDAAAPATDPTVKTGALRDAVAAAGGSTGAGFGPKVLDAAECAAVARLLRAELRAAPAARGGGGARGPPPPLRVLLSPRSLASDFGRTLARVDAQCGEGGRAGSSVGAWAGGPETLEARHGVIVVGFAARRRAPAPAPADAAAPAAAAVVVELDGEEELSRDGFEIIGSPPPPPPAGAKRRRADSAEADERAAAAAEDEERPAPFSTLLPLVGLCVPGTVFVRCLQRCAVEAGLDSVRDVAGIGGRFLTLVESWRAQIDAARGASDAPGSPPRARVLLLVDGLQAAVERATAQCKAEAKWQAAAAEVAEAAAAPAGGGGAGSAKKTRLSPEERAARSVTVSRPHIAALLAHLYGLGELEAVDVDAFAPAGGTVSAALGTANTPPGVVGREPGVLLSVVLGMLAAAAAAMPRRLHASLFGGLGGL